MRFSGGDEKYTYSVSLGYGDQNGVLRGTDSNRYTLAVNTTAQINSRLKIGANINAHYKIYNEPVAGVADLVEMTILWPSLMRVRTSINLYRCWLICQQSINCLLISPITSMWD